MAQRTTSQVRALWAPPCEREMTIIVLHTNVPVKVAVETRDAWRALDMVMQAHRYHVRSSDTGGFNCRNITNGKGYSLHAYGLAVDINWSTNPYRSDNKLITDMPSEMVTHILAIRTVGGVGVFGWGGNYRTFKDTMHYEILASPAELAAGIDWSTVFHNGDGNGGHPVLQLGDRGPSVEELQRLLKSHGFDPGPVDGIFGQHTLAAVRAYQASRQLDVDGIVGPQTWTALLSNQPAVTARESPVKKNTRAEAAALPSS